MESEKPLLPLAVPSSSGAGGVSPPVSMLILKEAMEGPARASDQAMTGMADGAPAGASEHGDNLKSGLEDRMRPLNRLCWEADLAAQTFNEAFLEASRANFEQALQLFQDLAGAKGPTEALLIHADYVGRQMQLFSQQAQELHLAFKKLFSASCKTAVRHLPSR